METIEYRGVVDKTTWARGPWDSESDKVQWRDEATGLPCLIVRGPCGFLCGYVGVTQGHPWHGQEYDSCGLTGPKPEGYEEGWYPEVHGGLTFSGGCSHGPAERSICHVPGKGEPDDVWWLGFDCGHVGDLTDMKYREEMRRRPPVGDTYRDVDYVRGEVEKLARQAAQVGYGN